MTRTPMTDDQLVSHIERLEAQATNNDSSTVAAEQAQAMDYYLGRPFGTEQEGRSAVVSSDVWDVVEGLTPLVLKPFVASDDIVRFNPEGPEDEDAAEQESDYINYVVTQRNDVFDALVAWVKTGLLQKNGVVKYWWDTSQRKRIERYEGLSEDTYLALLDDDAVSVIEHTEHPPEAVDAMQGEMQATHDVVLRISEEYGEPKFCVIPPEEFRISRTATSQNPKMARFVEHITRKTISELREMGYEVEDDISDTAGSDPMYSDQYTARMRDVGDQYTEEQAGDPAGREVLFREAFLYVDRDGDGIAELRKVCLVGHTLLSDEETEEIPFCGWTPYPQPFRFDGRCPADEAMEVQLIKSTILRQTMDNIYTVNNNTRYVSGKVNLDDMLDNQIAGIVRVDGDVVSNHVMPGPITPIGAITMPMIEYFDSAKENRTGFTRYNQGTDANSLNKTATGIRIISEASNERVGLVSRCFAEQGLKPLMLGIHGLCRRHGTKKEAIRLRGKWVEVDPRAWRTRYDMSVSVGLGNADKQMQMQGAQLLLETQLKLLESGIIKPQNIYEAGAKLAQALGEKNADKFFTMPDEQPAPPPDPTQDPAFKLQIAELQLKSQELEIKGREADAKAQQAMADTALKAREVDIKERDSIVSAGAKAAELQMRESEQSASHGLARMQFDHSTRPVEPVEPVESAEPAADSQALTLDAIKSLADAMTGAQAVMERMLKQMQPPVVNMPAINIAPPAVNVSPAAVTVSAPQVTVNTPPVSVSIDKGGKVRFTEDDAGNITGAEME